MLVGAFAAGAVAALHGLGLARARRGDRRLGRSSRWCTASPRSPARQPDRLRRRHQFLASGLTAFLGQAWFGGAGARRSSERARASPTITSARRGGDPRRPDPRPALSRRDLRPQPPRLSRLPRRAADRVGRLPHALRPAPARRRREPGRGRHRRHLGRHGCATARSSSPASSAASPAPTSRIAQSAGFGRDMTAGQGYIALAALIFANWRPWRVLGALLPVRPA